MSDTNEARDPCPQCQAADSGVLDSRPHPWGRSRRRECHGCGHRWRTIEVPHEHAAFLHNTSSQRRIAIAQLDLLRRTLLDIGLPMVDGSTDPDAADNTPIWPALVAERRETRQAAVRQPKPPPRDPHRPPPHPAIKESR